MKAFFAQSVGWLHRAVTGPQRRRKLLTPLFALVFLTVLAAAVCGSLFLDRLCGFAPFLPPWAATVFSLPFLFGGAGLWLWCVARFGMSKGTPVPVAPPPALVTDGPYAYSRNPMMGGVFLVFLGIGIHFGSLWLTFVTTPLLIAVSIVVLKNVEEPELELRFGEAYRQYRERTPMLFPRLWRR